MAGAEGGDGLLHLGGAGAEGLAEPLGDPAHLEVPQVALCAVSQLPELVGELGAVHGAGLGGDAVEGAGVDGGPSAGRGLPVLGAEGAAGDDAVVVELGVGRGAGLLLGLALAGGVVAEASDDQPLGALVADQACDAAADEGGMGFQVGAGDLDCLLVSLLDCVPGRLIAEGPDDGDGLGGREGAVDGGGVNTVGVADQLLAGAGILALPEADQLVTVHLA